MDKLKLKYILLQDGVEGQKNLSIFNRQKLHTVLLLKQNEFIQPRIMS